MTEESLARRTLAGVARVARDRSGQGTTEYAILVGVLVVTNASHWR